MTTSQRPDPSGAPNQSQSRLPTSAWGGRATSLLCQLSCLQLGADGGSCKHGIPQRVPQAFKWGPKAPRMRGSLAPRTRAGEGGVAEMEASLLGCG